MSIRQYFGLTQEQLAAWLLIPRSSIALAERGHQNLPDTKYWQRDMRLTLASINLALNPAGGPPVPAEPAPPPLPPDLEPLQKRLHACRYHATRLRYELQKMQEKAVPFQACLDALPTLRAWTGPDPKPEQGAAWLDRFEQEAVSELNYTCGPTPQKLLEVRMAAFEHEAGLLEQFLAPLLPAAPPAETSPQQ